jgi:hypothetical protein
VQLIGESFSCSLPISFAEQDILELVVTKVRQLSSPLGFRDPGFSHNIVELRNRYGLRGANSAKLNKIDGTGHPDL